MVNANQGLHWFWDIVKRYSETDSAGFNRQTRNAGSTTGDYQPVSCTTHKKQVETSAQITVIQDFLAEHPLDKKQD
ncbi:hypothetical protein BIZ31_12775 [Lactiplantibacillus plantarum]|nr:hypothetical protein [Lactiplantibacillus plantarum]ARO01653.1 hypothetical protein BIZ31_12775 [Lactiplantibacillus plantarum]ARO04560.1 hypothetical protein BIZ32_12585 [Lactiplantibacillus plantarum]AXH05560.1 hypothetical protein CEB41_14160 [Lactiplantibacillus plantarum]MDY2576248.1 hypothetical protein [Lactiplantibacillus plantarum]